MSTPTLPRRIASEMPPFQNRSVKSIEPVKRIDEEKAPIDEFGKLNTEDLLKILIREQRLTRQALKGMHDAYILRQPQLDPQKELYYYAFYGGEFFGRGFTVAAGERERLLYVKGTPLVLAITAISAYYPEGPATNPPYFGLQINTDGIWEVSDWTAEELHSLFGLDQPDSDYGYCSKYDSTNFSYTAVTHWMWPMNRSIEIYVKNYSDSVGAATVNMFDIQMYSYGGPEYIKFSKYPWLG